MNKIKRIKKDEKRGREQKRREDRTQTKGMSENIRTTYTTLTVLQLKHGLTSRDQRISEDLPTAWIFFKNLSLPG
jgi:hypothetical protein